MHHKRFAILAGLLLAVALPASVLAQGDSKKFNQTVDLNAGGRLTLKTFKGSIKLTSWDRNQVEVIAHIEPGDDVDDDYAEESVAATRIDISGSGSSVRIKSDYDDVPCRRSFKFFGINTGCSKTLPFVHYEIRAPRELDLRLEDYKSEITLRDLEGNLEIKTYKGIIEAASLAGDLRLETYKGRAEIDSIRGSLDIETYKGDILIESASVNNRSKMQTYKGTISLTLPASQKLDIRADLGKRADFHSDFALTTRTFGRGHLEGSINGGGPLLTIESYKGEIRLRQQ
jgi:hypothetical protein